MHQSLQSERDLCLQPGKHIAYLEIDIQYISELLAICLSFSNDNLKLATYTYGWRGNFLSPSSGKSHGIDAAYAVHINTNRKLVNTFLNKEDVDLRGFPANINGYLTYDELKIASEYSMRVMKTGRATGLSTGQWVPIDIAVSTIDKRDQQDIFLDYMKSSLPSTIQDGKNECFPRVWFDRQLAIAFPKDDNGFRNNGFAKGDSGSTVVNEKGQVLGLLHASFTLTFGDKILGIASPFFAVLEALDVHLYL